MNTITLLTLLVSHLATGPKFDVLAQAPEFTQTDLQVICLFRTSPKNKFTGALTATDHALKGLLSEVRAADRFSGVLGETLLITPPAGQLKAKQLLVIGLGDSETFSPDRMRLIGRVFIRTCDILHVTHPYFAPTVKDGGVGQFTTGQVAEQFVRGTLDAVKMSEWLHSKGASSKSGVTAITYLAGKSFAASTQSGIRAALSGSN